MNYAVYTHQVIDGQDVCAITAYVAEDDPVTGKGFHLMSKAEAEAYAATAAAPGRTVMALPLELDQAITAF